MQPSHFLLVLLAGWINRDQQAVIDYLLEVIAVYQKQQGRKRLRLDDDTRRRLAVKGRKLGRKLLRELPGIVIPDTLLRWHHRLIAQKWDYSKRRKKQGRPPVSSELEKLVLKLAQENSSWGYDRIQGALQNLGHKISATTIANILKRYGLEPAPKRPTRWKEFLKAHWHSIAAVDFCTVEVWTLRGLKTFYVLVAIDLATRRVKIAGVTSSPVAIWMQGAAERLVSEPEHFLAGHKYLIHDRDTKFCRLFARLFEAQGIVLLKLPPRSPNMNAYCERFIRSLQEECIRRMIFFGETSLRNALNEYVEHYHRERNHQGLENRLIDPGEELQIRDGPIGCRERLGGMYKYYHRRAA